MNYYDILEVNKNASIETIKAAYRSLAQKYHPDKNSSKEDEGKMQQINIAYEILSDNIKRKKYDDSNINNSNTQTNQFNISVNGIITLLTISEQEISFNKTILKYDNISILATEQNDKDYLITIGDSHNALIIKLQYYENNNSVLLFNEILNLLKKNFYSKLISYIVAEISNKGYFDVINCFKFTTSGIFIDSENQTNLNLFIPYDKAFCIIQYNKIKIGNRFEKDNFQFNITTNIFNWVIFHKIIEFGKQNINIGNKKHAPLEQYLTKIKLKQELDARKLKQEQENLNLIKNKLKSESEEYFYHPITFQNKRKKGVKFWFIMFLYAITLFIMLDYIFRITKIDYQKKFENTIQNKFFPNKFKTQIQSNYLNGIRYFYGDGVEKNYIVAYKYFEDAANHGHIESCNYLGIIYLNGLGIQQNISHAIHWFNISAEKKDGYALYNLGNIYYFGFGTNKNIQKAFEYYNNAVTNNNIEANINLGLMYLTGEGVNKDLNKSFQLFQIASEHQLKNGQYNLGIMYLYGYGTKKDKDKALSLFKFAAKQGQDDAIKLLKSLN